MTPWGIRNRLKGALGRAPAPSSTPQVELRLVLPDGDEHTVRCEVRYTLVMASQTLETPIATACPDGHCGKCAVDVLDGTGLAPPSPAEQRILTEFSLPADVRLACHAKVAASGAKVRVREVWTMSSVKGD